MARKDGQKLIAANRKARRNYEVLETIEAGLVLRGSEVKSLREAQVQIGEAFALIDRGEVWLHGMHVAPYTHAQTHSGHDPDRKRKLLLHGAEIERLRPRSTSSACRWCRWPCTSRRAGPRSSWRWPGAAGHTTSARCSPSATPSARPTGPSPGPGATDGPQGVQRRQPTIGATRSDGSVTTSNPSRSASQRRLRRCRSTTES